MAISKNKYLSFFVTLFLFFLLSLISVNALQDEQFLNRESILFAFRLNSSLTLQPSDPKEAFRLQRAVINLSFFPLEDINQQILSTNLSSSPSSLTSLDKQSGQASYVFKNLSSSISQLDYFAQASINTYHLPVQIDASLPYPLKFDDIRSVREYLRETKNIDSEDDLIIAQANSIIQDENDLYQVVFEISKWIINNVEYNLSTLTADITQKSSWVLENRYGVCDEITSLFIAMTRSLGIPARFVNGLAYTNYNNLNDFGPHAWAEVYFPGYGWVPFDLTYKQLGWIDPTHIKMEHSLDSQTPSVYYNWQGFNVQLQGDPLLHQINLLDLGSLLKENLSLQTQLLHSKTGFGSYNLVQTNIQNKHPYYYFTQVRLNKPKEVSLLSPESQLVLLAPHEEKILYWLIQTESQLSPSHSYSLPLRATTLRNISSETNLILESGQIVYSFEELNQTYNALSPAQKEGKQKIYSQQVNFDCQPPSEVLLGQSFQFDCSLENIGDISLQDVRVCYDDWCQSTSLDAGQKESLQFEKTFFQAGEQALVLKAENEDISKISTLNFLVLDSPQVSISIESLPSKIGYQQNFNLTFLIKKESFTSPTNLTFEIIINKESQILDIEQLNNQQRIILSLNSALLKPGQNRVLIREKHSFNKQEFRTSQEAYINLVGLSFWQRLSSWLRNLF